jgi:hypothetical protein
MYIEDTKERLVTEIEMLKVVLYLVSRSKEVEKEKEEKEMILEQSTTKYSHNPVLLYLLQLH